MFFVFSCANDILTLTFLCDAAFFTAIGIKKCAIGALRFTSFRMLPADSNVFSLLFVVSYLLLLRHFVSNRMLLFLSSFALPFYGLFARFRGVFLAQIAILPHHMRTSIFFISHLLYFILMFY